MWNLNRRVWQVAVTTALASLAAVSGPTAERQAAPPQAPPGQSLGSGQAVTVLPDGRRLLSGGDAAPSALLIHDPTTGSTSAAPGRLQTPRAGHTATLLADGRILIAGGRTSAGDVVPLAEIIDANGTALAPPLRFPAPRSGHTATLLSDGRVLFLGGASGSGEPVITVDVWDPNTLTTESLRGALHIGRRGHTARLLSDGRVLVSGGSNSRDEAIAGGEIYDPVQQASTSAAFDAVNETAVYLAGSSPIDGASGVSTELRHLALHFSNELSVSTISERTVRLESAQGVVPLRVVPAEAGRLAFVRPQAPLATDTAYVLTIDGALDATGAALSTVRVRFTTESTAPPTPTAPVDEEVWTPGGSSGWRTGRPPSQWQQLKPLQAPPGVTALAGQALRLDGRPLINVLLEIEGKTARTDGTGRFLLRLDGFPSGWRELWIDGRPANRPNAVYGTFEVGMTIVGGRTNVLPYTIWMPALDMAHAVTIPSPTTGEIVISTPLIPGLELRLPPSAVVRDHERQTVRQITITPVPLDRPPFPLPGEADVPQYFTIQPGGAYVYVHGTSGERRGARLIYPNPRRVPAGTPIDFWHYEPEGPGWHVYGEGSVSADGSQIVPNTGVELYEFTGAMAALPGFAPSTWPGILADFWDWLTRGGDPVDLSTGIYVLERTDLFLPDVIPIALNRTYRPGDTRSRAFGIGATQTYDMFLIGDDSSYLDLILADGSRIHYNRIAGSSWQTSTYEHVATPTPFYKSRIVYANDQWELTLRDGTFLSFGYGPSFFDPLLNALRKIRDRFGNEVQLVRQANKLTRIVTQNGRWIELTYDASNRITEARDNLGRVVDYTYDPSGRVHEVTDPEGRTTTYTYDAAHRLETITDPRDFVWLTNEYDINGRVFRQTQADDTTYEFDYTVVGDVVTEAEETNPRGYVRRVTFDSAGFMTSHTEAVGTSLERTTTFTRDPTSHAVTSVLDPLNRRTDYGYDAKGNLTSVTPLAGTADAITTTTTYEPFFSQPATVTDPLNHTTRFLYALGKPSGIVDPLGQITTLGTNISGQITSSTDPLGHTSQIAYELGDPATVTDPLGRTATNLFDGAGRGVRMTDALGRTAVWELDRLNQVTKVVDPLSGETSFTYDPNGNQLTVTDASTHTTTYTYNSMDRVETREDPLERVESYLYDANGNLQQVTDRKQQISTFAYDALDRLTLVTYADQSTTAYTYDAGDRLREIVDSVAGTITRNYDGLDRLTSETTPEGTVGYTYDAAGRRATMTVPGQSTVTYGYDDADRLTSITQGASLVTFGYDASNRRTSTTLPNGVVVEYTYDPASQLTEITYTDGEITLGTLTYTYDAAGQRTAVGGSFARTGLPPTLASATYDAANQILTWAGTPFTYDANGNLTSDGSRTYTWNARNQLTGISGAASASFAYDGSGRRRAKTVGAGSTQFLFDGLNPVQEQSGGSPSAQLLNRALDEYFSRADASGPRHFLTDALGSTVALVDDSSVVQTSYTFEPFGSTSTTGEATSNTFAFTGREADGTGLYFYRARYYDPRLQRFISEDPLQFGGGDLNLHAYVGNSPTMDTDPTGEFVWAPWVVACVAGAGEQLFWDWMDGVKLSGRKVLWRGARGCAQGLAFGAGVGWGRAAVGALQRSWARRAVSQRMLDSFRRQFEQHGRRSLERSLNSLERRLAEHLRKLEQARAAGGPTSSIEREIRTFRNSIEAIRNILGGNK